MHWLQFLDSKEGFSSGISGADAGGSDANCGDPSDREPAAIDEDEFLAGCAALERVRADAGDDVVAKGAKGFTPRARGGTSEIRKSGEVVHAMQGQCSNQDPE